MVTPCGRSGHCALKLVGVEPEYENAPALTLPLLGMAKAVLIWESLRRRKNAMKTRALIVSNCFSITVCNKENTGPHFLSSIL